jgi:hypothetical protein
MKRRSAFQKWRDKKFPKEIQAKIDGFANAPDVADELERVFRAGWMAYCLLSPTFEGNQKEKSKD